MKNPAATARHSGTAAMTGAALVMLSVGAELMRPVQRTDGSVTEMGTFLVIVTLWAVGMAGLLHAALGLGAVHRAAGPPLPRAGRSGAGVVVVGAALEVCFGLLGAVSAALTGTPAEASFLLFSVGFLLLAVGGAMVGSGVRRGSALRPTSAPLWLGAAAALATVVLFVDPWHDVALFAFLASWVVVGVLLVRLGRRLADPTVQREARATTAPGP